MCLEVITKRHVPTLPGPIVAYKVFRRLPHKQLGSCCVREATKLPTRKIIDEKFFRPPFPLDSDYGAGWHAFKDLESAKQYKNTEVEVIRKVHLYNVHTEGLTCITLPTYVSTHMRILNEVK